MVLAVGVMWSAGEGGGEAGGGRGPSCVRCFTWVSFHCFCCMECGLSARLAYFYFDEVTDMVCTCLVPSLVVQRDHDSTFGKRRVIFCDTRSLDFDFYFLF